MHVKYCSLDVYFIVNWLALFVTLYIGRMCDDWLYSLCAEKTD